MDQIKRFATPNHQNLLENLRNTEVVFYDTLFKSAKLNLNLYLKNIVPKLNDLYLFEIKNIIPLIIRFYGFFLIILDTMGI